MNIQSMQSSQSSHKVPTMQSKTTAISHNNIVNVLLDVAIFFVFLLVHEVHATGAALHEWIGVAIAGTLLTHILLHWQWVATTTMRFTKRMGISARLNYIINVLLFVAFTLATVSGLMLSETILPMLGVEAAGSPFWHMLHSFSADATMLLVALHIALHWRWLVATVKRLVKAPAPHLAHPQVISVDRIIDN